MVARVGSVLEIPDFVAADGTKAKVAGRLIDFTTGKSSLTEGHKAWLQGTVIPVILGLNSFWIDLYGYASKRGNRDFNLKLSRARAQSVKAYLVQELAKKGRAIGDRFNIDQGFGEDAPGYDAAESNNSPYWRAAEVVVFGTKPVIVRPVPKPEPVSLLFEIRVLGGASVGAGVQSDNYLFQIVDLVKRQTSVYHYTAVGAGASIPPFPGPGSMTKAGPPTPFKTNRPAALYQFNARASLLQEPGVAMGGSIGGKFYLTLKDMRDSGGAFLGTIPKVLTIDGGSEIQMPSAGSLTEGVMAWMGAVYPFTGY